MGPADDGPRRTMAWMGPAGSSESPAPVRAMRWVPSPNGPVDPDHAASTPAPASASAEARESGHHRGELVDGRYRLERALGAGALTETWEATHVELGRAVAIKFLRESPQLQADAVGDELLDAARASAKIQHPHMAEWRDVGRLGAGAPFFVMELLTGGTLEQLLSRRGSVAWARAVRIIEQVAAALAAAHLAGVVHRDLRPANVFLVDTGQPGDFVKVVDFGLARGAWGGAPAYMSPEQCRGESLDARADVYAIGCLIHALIVGEPPFVGDPTQLRWRQINEVPKPLADRAPRQFIPKELEAVAARCLEKLPARRFADIRELLAALSELSSFTAAAGMAGGGAAIRDPGAGARPMSYAGRPAPRAAKELSAARDPKVKHAAKPSSEPPVKRAGMSIGTVIGLGLASSLAIVGVGLGVWWLVARLIAAGPGSAPPAEQAAAPADASASEASEPPTVPSAEITAAAVEPLEPLEPPESSEPSAAAGHGVDASAAAAGGAPEARADLAKPNQPSGPEPAADSEPASKPAPATKPASSEKPSIKPESKANEGIAHEDLVDPWQ